MNALDELEDRLVDLELRKAENDIALLNFELSLKRRTTPTAAKPKRDSGCASKCTFSGIQNQHGDRLMIAAAGNPRFKAGTTHTECVMCVRPRVCASVRKMAQEERDSLQRSGRYSSLTDRQRGDLEERLHRGL